LWGWLKDGSKFGNAFDHILTSYTNFYEIFYGERMTHQHDALAMAEAIWPNIMELEPAFIDVECQGELTIGMTVTDTRLRNGVEPNGYVAWSIDGDGFHQKLMSAFAKMSASVGN
jgi:inosine-uridine nucleoside N-ribohydrolase